MLLRSISEFDDESEIQAAAATSPNAAINAAATAALPFGGARCRRHVSGSVLDLIFGFIFISFGAWIGLYCT